MNIMNLGLFQWFWINKQIEWWISFLKLHTTPRAACDWISDLHKTQDDRIRRRHQKNSRFRINIMKSFGIFVLLFFFSVVNLEVSSAKTLQLKDLKNKKDVSLHNIFLPPWRTNLDLTRTLPKTHLPGNSWRSCVKAIWVWEKELQTFSAAKQWWRRKEITSRGTFSSVKGYFLVCVDFQKNLTLLLENIAILPASCAVLPHSHTRACYFNCNYYTFPHYNSYCFTYSTNNTIVTNN